MSPVAPKVLRHSEEGYWDPAALKGEVQRVFDICHGCRRCVHLCPSFGNLFKRIDSIDDALNPLPQGGRGEGEGPSLLSAKNPVDALTDVDRQRVVDECYQCKLCYNHCPYHPPHRFALDFPRLMQRAKAVSVRQGGGTWADRLFAQVDLLGRAAGPAADLVNWLHGRRWFRVLLEKVLGIHRDRNLPPFHAETFRDWWDWRGPNARAAGRVALFYTCSVNYNEPATGKAAVAVLERNGFEVLVPPQLCCGMPHLDGGDIASAVSAAGRNLVRLLPLARQGVPILALGPTCSYMLKEEYPALLGTEDARFVAANTYDICEYLMMLHRQGRLDTAFKPLPGKIAYHLACHLKSQNIGCKSRDLLALLPGAEVEMVDRCSAHDGTWGMKARWYELSMRRGKMLFDEIGEAASERVATDCPLAALQIEEGTGRTAEHPVRLVAKAYGIDPDNVR